MRKNEEEKSEREKESEREKSRDNEGRRMFHVFINVYTLGLSRFDPIHYPGFIRSHKKP